MNDRRVGLVAIGASAGGVMAIRSLLRDLDANYSPPIVVVQHLLPSSRNNVAMVYATGKGHHILEVEDKMPLRAGAIYMASPGYHLLLEKDFSFALSMDDPVNYSRPSIDVFFESVAHAAGSHATGILLTGANSDGAYGLKEIGQAGGTTIVQDPVEAEVDVMPKSALRLFRPDHVLGLQGIAKYMNGLNAKNTELFI